MRCFTVCATTQPFLLPCSANCCVPEQRAPYHGGVFDSLSFQSKNLKFARFGNWGGGVFGGPIFDKNFAIHAKLKLGKFFIFFEICSGLWELGKRLRMIQNAFSNEFHFVVLIDLLCTKCSRFNLDFSSRLVYGGSNLAKSS